jgi:hypothetical protein
VKDRRASQIRGGWEIDGVEYPNARAAAEAIGVSKDKLCGRCNRLGRRRVTSTEIAMASRTSGNDEWRRMSDTRNTGAGRGSEVRP